MPQQVHITANMQSLIALTTLLSTIVISLNCDAAEALDYDLDSIHHPSELLQKRHEEEIDRNRISNWLESLPGIVAPSPDISRRALLYQTLAKRASDLLSRAVHTDEQGRPIPALKARVHKRHCWDVADICCMWDVC